MFPADIRSIAACLYRELNTPLSLKLLNWLELGEYTSILRERVDPNCYANAEDYFKDACAVNFLKKCVDVPTDVDPKLEAMKAWLRSEEQCYKTNLRFRKHIVNGPFEDPDDVRIDGILRLVRTNFQKIVGNVPRDLIGARHGPGSTISDRQKYSTLPDKISSRPTCSSKARCLLDLWVKTAWFRELANEHPRNSDPSICDWEELLFVNKNALIKRGISLSPSINVFYQLGVSPWLRRSLRRTGIDLETGQALHVQVARVASRDDSDVTVDVRSASDTLAYLVVQFLATPAWFEVLDTLRMGVSRLPNGELHRLQKFSAMGNGYTFELETCVFLSIAVTAMELVGLEPRPGRNVFVYGDDIIVPKAASTLLLAMLKYFGFEPNLSKTFLQGKFRESCGGDFFSGIPVRAYCMEEFPKEPQDWIKLANGLRATALVGDDGVWARPYLRKTWFKVLDQIPSHIRKLRGPEWLGDLLIHDSIPDAGKTDDGNCFNGHIRHGIRKWRVYKPFSTAVKLVHWKPGIQLASALLGVPSSGPIPRGDVSGYRFCLVPSDGGVKATDMIAFHRAQFVGPLQVELKSS